MILKVPAYSSYEHHKRNNGTYMAKAISNSNNSSNASNSTNSNSSFYEKNLLFKALGVFGIAVCVGSFISLRRSVTNVNLKEKLIKIKLFKK